MRNEFADFLAGFQDDLSFPPMYIDLYYQIAEDKYILFSRLLQLVTVYCFTAI